jgi:hypothetical protein
MVSASVYDGDRARGYWVAPMEASMGMRCWILLVFVIVEPVEGKVSFWDHQTPGWNHLTLVGFKSAVFGPQPWRRRAGASERTTRR